MEEIKTQQPVKQSIKEVVGKPQAKKEVEKKTNGDVKKPDKNSGKKPVKDKKVWKIWLIIALILIVAGIGFYILFFVYGISPPYSDELNCTDWDGGLSYDVEGNVTFGKNVSFDECNDQGQFGDDPRVIKEYFCKDNEVEEKMFTCVMACKDGACLVNASEEDLRCRDSDWGDNPHIKGRAFNATHLENDVCDGVDFVLEAVCNKGAVETPKRECENGCLEGACVQVEDG